jgi:hypothetical protein
LGRLLVFTCISMFMLTIALHSNTHTHDYTETGIITESESDTFLAENLTKTVDKFDVTHFQQQSLFHFLLLLFIHLLIFICIVQLLIRILLIPIFYQSSYLGTYRFS